MYGRKSGTGAGSQNTAAFHWFHFFRVIALPNHKGINESHHEVCHKFLIFIHSVVCLTTVPERLLKWVLHRVRSSATISLSVYSIFLFFLSSSSSCLCLLHRLHVISTFPSITCFRRQFLRKMWPIQLAFLLFLLFEGYSSRPWLFETLFHISHDQSNWSSPSLSSTTFQNFPGVSDLLSEVSKFQRHTKLYTKCSTFASFFLKFKSSLLVLSTI